jgi:hypothetical protein
MNFYVTWRVASPISAPCQILILELCLHSAIILTSAYSSDKSPSPLPVIPSLGAAFFCSGGTRCLRTRRTSARCNCCNSRIGASQSNKCIGFEESLLVQSSILICFDRSWQVNLVLCDLGKNALKSLRRGDSVGVVDTCSYVCLLNCETTSKGPSSCAIKATDGTDLITMLV